jgi:hypothetical protein
MNEVVEIRRSLLSGGIKWYKYKVTATTAKKYGLREFAKRN